MNLKNSLREFLRYRNAYFLAISASAGCLCYGWDIGLIGGVIALPSFRQYFELGKKSAAARASLNGNIVSIFQAGGLVGALLSMWFSGRYGRKRPLMAGTIIFLIGSVIQSIAGLGSTPAVGLKILHFGRFVGGIGVGKMVAIIPTYISECAPRVIRGRCTGTVELCTSLGFMLAFWVNYGVSIQMPIEDMQWRLPLIIQIIPGVLMLMLMTPQPESPRWLTERGRYDDAAKSLAYIVRADASAPEVQATLAEIRADFAGKPRFSLWSQLRQMGETRTIAYRCFVPSLMMFFQQWSGTTALNYYAPQIFTSVGMSSTTSSLLATGVYGVVRHVSAIAAVAFVIESWGRKGTLFYGGFIQGLTMFWIGGFIAVHSQSTKVPATYVSIVAIYIFGIANSLGWGFTPVILGSEIAPSHLRPAVMGLAIGTIWLFSYTVTQLVPHMLNKITWKTYIVFGVANVVMIAFVWFGVPETTGVVLEDVRWLFEGPRVLVRFVKDAPGGRWVLGRLGILEWATPSIDQLKQRTEAGVVLDTYDVSGESEGMSDTKRKSYSDALII